jgi:plasmid replication initiation protein
MFSDLGFSFLPAGANMDGASLSSSKRIFAFAVVAGLRAGGGRRDVGNAFSNVMAQTVVEISRRSQSLQYRRLRFRLQCRGVYVHPKRVVSVHPYCEGVCDAAAPFYVQGRAPVAALHQTMGQMRGQMRRALAR